MEGKFNFNEEGYTKNYSLEDVENDKTYTVTETYTAFNDWTEINIFDPDTGEDIEEGEIYDFVMEKLN